MVEIENKIPLWVYDFDSDSDSVCHQTLSGRIHLSTTETKIHTFIENLLKRKNVWIGFNESLMFKGTLIFFFYDFSYTLEQNKNLKNFF